MKKNLIFLLCFITQLFSTNQHIYAEFFQSEENTIDPIPQCEACYNCCEKDSWILYPFTNRLYLRNTSGKGIGYRGNYTTLGVFFTPKISCEWLRLFSDSRIHIFDNGKKAANIGLGSRFLIPCIDMVFGVNAYYDFRQAHHHGYDQIGIGIELLGPCVDFRFNGYLPINHKETNKYHRFHFGDENEFFFVTKESFIAVKGYDLEIGTWLKKRSLCDCLGLYFAVGPYYYRREDCGCDCDGVHVWGVTGRVTAQIGDYITFSINDNYDPTWRNTVETRIELTFPLGCQPFQNNSCRTNCDCGCLLDEIAAQPVNRRDIIPIYEDCTWVEWNWGESSDYTSISE
ncbi:MAG: inverse autotransporter beta domain-containing protein [Parachlamydiaceae bacterium]|nr:inverse autotransporter beta domain-containing protein [Parachlamydiaceae bacterium]